METISLLHAIEKMIDNLPTWHENAIIYQYKGSGIFARSPRSTYETVSRAYETTIIYECHDLDEVFPDFGNCEDDAAWLLAQLINDYLGTYFSNTF